MKADGTYTLLIADDEPDILAMLKDYFASQGYRVLAARNGDEALQLAQEGPDLVLLDVAMPKTDGLETCRRLRRHIRCPILFLTARVEDDEALEGFEAGADDYIAKPFSLPVLAARVAAHLAREGRQGASGATEVRFADNVAIDFRQCAVFVNDAPVTLTPREFAIVSLLAKQPGRVFDRDLIHQKVGGWDAASSPLVVTEHVRRIRKKLLDAGAERDLIETVWGLGYRWRG